MIEKNPFHIILNEQRNGRKIIYIPNPGNLGDALICAATLQIFSKLGINYIEYVENHVHDPLHFYVYGGGGALNPMYIDHIIFLDKLNRDDTDLLILPSSIFGVDDFILSFKGNLTIFVRERKSWSYLRSLGSDGFQYYLYDDVATLLDVSDPLLSQYHFQNSLLRSVGDRSARRLNSFRKDQESLNVDKTIQVANNFDISDMWPVDPFLDKGFYFHWVDPAKVFSCASWFLNCINLFNEIHTDRLHVGIVGCLLGKKVFLYDNSYGKVSGVYEYSLQKNIDYDVSMVQHWV